MKKYISFLYIHNIDPLSALNQLYGILDSVYILYILLYLFYKLIILQWSGNSIPTTTPITSQTYLNIFNRVYNNPDLHFNNPVYFAITITLLPPAVYIICFFLLYL